MSQHNSLSDSELLLLLKKGNHSAYTEIFTRYNSLLYSHAYNKTRSREDAKDLVHEIFYSLWIRRESITPNINLASYLFTAVRYKIADLFSKNKSKEKYIESLQNFIDSQPPHTDYLVRENQLRSIINEEIENLPPRMREVFKMSRFEQLSHKEIAEKMGISEETVKDQVKKALKTLRTKLGLVLFLLFYYNLL